MDLNSREDKNSSKRPKQSKTTSKCGGATKNIKRNDLNPSRIPLRTFSMVRTINKTTELNGKGNATCNYSIRGNDTCAATSNTQECHNPNSIHLIRDGKTFATTNARAKNNKLKLPPSRLPLRIITESKSPKITKTPVPKCDGNAICTNSISGAKTSAAVSAEHVKTCATTNARTKNNFKPPPSRIPLRIVIKSKSLKVTKAPVSKCDGNAMCTNSISGTQTSTVISGEHDHSSSPIVYGEKRAPTTTGNSSIPIGIVGDAENAYMTKVPVPYREGYANHTSSVCGNDTFATTNHEHKNRNCPIVYGQTRAATTALNTSIGIADDGETTTRSDENCVRSISSGIDISLPKNYDSSLNYTVSDASDDFLSIPNFRQQNPMSLSTNQDFVASKTECDYRDKIVDQQLRKELKEDLKKCGSKKFKMSRTTPLNMFSNSTSDSGADLTKLLRYSEVRRTTYVQSDYPAKQSNLISPTIAEISFLNISKQSRRQHPNPISTYDLNICNSSLRCPEKNCNQEVPFSEFIQHLIVAHSTLTVTRISAGECTNVFFNANVALFNRPTLHALFLVRNCLFGTTSGKSNDLIPTLLSSMFIHLYDIIGYTPKNAEDLKMKSKNDIVLLIWAMTTIDKEIPIKVSLTVWPIDGRCPDKSFCYVGDALSLRTPVNIKDLIASGNLIILNAEQIHCLTNGGKDSIAVQIIVE